jgi:hypothetical protein
MRLHGLTVFCVRLCVIVIGDFYKINAWTGNVITRFFQNIDEWR